MHSRLGTTEQEVIGLPKEDLVLFFHVPVGIEELVNQKPTAIFRDKKDIYEESTAIQEAVERLYLELASHRSNWKTIECVTGTILRTREEIQKIYLTFSQQTGYCSHMKISVTAG